MQTQTHRADACTSPQAAEPARVHRDPWFDKPLSVRHREAAETLREMADDRSRVRFNSKEWEALLCAATTLDLLAQDAEAKAVTGCAVVNVERLEGGAA